MIVKTFIGDLQNAEELDKEVQDFLEKQPTGSTFSFSTTTVTYTTDSGIQSFVQTMTVFVIFPA